MYRILTIAEACLAFYGFNCIFQCFSYIVAHGQVEQVWFCPHGIGGKGEGPEVSGLTSVTGNPG